MPGIASIKEYTKNKMLYTEEEKNQPHVTSESRVNEWNKKVSKECERHNVICK